MKNFVTTSSVRLALGSRPIDIFKLVLGKGALLSATGLALGFAASFPAIKLLAKSLKESMFLVSRQQRDVVVRNSVRSDDFGCIDGLFHPGRRATKVDPMVALRYE